MIGKHEVWYSELDSDAVDELTIPASVRYAVSAASKRSLLARLRRFYPREPVSPGEFDLGVTSHEKNFGDRECEVHR